VRFLPLFGSLVMHFCVASEAIFWQGLRGEIRDFLEDRVRISLLSLGPYSLTLAEQLVNSSLPVSTVVSLETGQAPSVSWGQGQRPSW
jgi:hypothetical protein